MLRCCELVGTVRCTNKRLTAKLSLKLGLHLGTKQIADNAVRCCMPVQKKYKLSSFGDAVLPSGAAVAWLKAWVLSAADW